MEQLMARFKHKKRDGLLKYAALFMLLCIPFLEVGAQEKKVTLECVNEKLTDALKKVEKQSGYKIIFSYNELQTIKVSASIRNATAVEAVRRLIEGKQLNYSVDRQYIHIFQNKENAKRKEGNITGQVVDENNDPLPGVNVRVKGVQNLGALTDMDGQFSIPSGKDQTTALTFSFIGKETVEMQATAGRNLTVRLSETVKSVDEVVVTGIFTRKKESFTGSSTTFSEKELKMVGNGNILESLKTLDPSFAIIENTTMGSNPNQALNIEIRGKTSVIGLSEEYGTDPNQPLFILDGFESSLATISDLSMDRIQNITVLKDAAATAIYGSKAANGVVVVETKAPKAGELRINYNGNLNLTFADLSDYNLMNAEEKIQFELLSGVYGSLNSADGHIGSLQQEQLYNSRLAEIRRGVDTYWMNEPLRFAVSHRHNVFLEGGDKTLRYGVGVNYGKTEGVMKGSDRDLINGNVRLIYRKGRMAFTNNLNINYTKAAHESVPFSRFAQTNPFFRKTDENGNPIKVLESFSYLDINTFAVKYINVYSPFYDLSNNNFNTTAEYGFTNNFEADWRAIDELRIRAKIGLTKANEQLKKFSSPYNVEYIGKEDDEKGLYTESNKNTWNYDLDLSATYGKLLGKYHQVNAVAGIRLAQTSYNLGQYAMQGFIDDEFSNPLFAQDYDISQRVYQEIKRRTASYYLNASYSFDNRYLLDVSWRADGASVFGVNKLFTNTWSVGLGWNLHNEAFMKNLKWIDILKIRGSIGNPGNQNFNDYISMKIYEYNNHHINPWGVSTIIKTFGNSDLKWQKTLDRNIGFDLVVLDNRLRFNVDYFSKKTDPLLVYMNLPPSTGSTSIPTNVGGQLTTGYTLVANYQIFKKRELMWSVNTTLRHLHSEYRNVSQYLSQFNELNRSKNLIRYYDGGSPSDLWAVRSAGIDAATGREIFIRKDGTQTFTHSYDDEVVVGNTEPDVEGIIGTSFYYKGFSASVNLRYRVGGQIFMSALYNKVENISVESAHYNQDKRALYDRWKQPGDIAKFKAISTSSSTPISSRFVSDNNILSGESVSIGYETQASWLQRIGASSITVRAYMNDFFRVSTVKEERGIDYPFARSVSMSLGLRF